MSDNDRSIGEKKGKREMGGTSTRRNHKINADDDDAFFQENNGENGSEDSFM